MPTCAKCHAKLNPLFRGGRTKEAAAHGFCLPCLSSLETHHGWELLALIEEVPHGAILVDADFRIRAANGPACDLLRTTWVALLGHQLGEFIRCDHPHELDPSEGGHASPESKTHAFPGRKGQHREGGAVIRPSREVMPPPPASEAALRIASLSVGDFVLVRLDPKGDSARVRFHHLVGQHLAERWLNQPK